MPVQEITGEPLMNIQWLETRQLSGNDYNPNVVHNAELRLLEHSILTSGWVQPILVRVMHSQSGDYHIIDGFHRWSLSCDSKKLQAKYNGKVPCAVLDITRPEAMLLTIRINRAKGTHVALRMADVVSELVDVHDMSYKDIAQNIGGTVREVEMLHVNDLFKKLNLKDHKYSKAWVPYEDRK